MLRSRSLAAALLLAATAACAIPTPTPTASSPHAEAAPVLRSLAERLRALLPAPGDTLEVSVAVRDLATGDSILLDAHRVMHAASTMKVPVMLELFRRAEAGELRLDTHVPVRDHFRSIADGSTYRLSAQDDSDPELYAAVGGVRPLRELMERMIVRSSNLATNLLIDYAAPERIAATLRAIDARGVTVLRGVEDGPAFRAGMNNTTSAYGMMQVFAAIADGRVVGPAATEEMVRILAGQEFREMIPAGLPEGTRVGNKTGWITGINHDAAVVFPPGRAPYVLVVLTRGYRDRDAARDVARAVSAAVWAELATRPSD
jgi:beta-lactamase class A